MKKRLFLGLLLSIFYFSACKKDVPKYSCDPIMEKFLSINAIDYQDITRSDLAKMGIDSQFAIFRALAPEDKKRIYNEKISAILLTENFSPQERNHLNLLKNYYSSNMYNGDGPDSFLISWEAVAKDSLMWNDTMFENYVCTWMLAFERANPSIWAQVGDGNACNCRYDISCYWTLETCSSGCETPPNGGCGIVGTANCTGKCGL